MQFFWKDVDGKRHLSNTAFEAIMYTLWLGMVCASVVACAYFIG